MKTNFKEGLWTILITLTMLYFITTLTGSFSTLEEYGSIALPKIFGSSFFMSLAFWIVLWSGLFIAIAYLLNTWDTFKCLLGSFVLVFLIDGAILGRFYWVGFLYSFLYSLVFLLIAKLIVLKLGLARYP